MQTKITRAQALALLQKYNQEPFHILHGLTVEGTMRYFAREMGENEDFWGLVGLLHDVDFEKYPDEHCRHVRELLEPEGVDEADIRAIISHGYGLCTEECKPETNLEKSLFTVDELTGIVMTTALMRPTGISDMEVKSVKKKFKDKKFAAKCSREVILEGCGMLSLDLDTVLALTIRGMQAHMEELSLGPKE